MHAQLEFLADDPPEASVIAFADYLRRVGWRTRHQLAGELDLDERQIRRLAEAAGKSVIRGPRGFNHLFNVPVDEADHCANIFIQQGRKMEHLGLAWKAALHARIAHTPEIKTVQVAPTKHNQTSP